MNTQIRRGLPNDAPYIRDLAAKEFWQLGFVPHTTYIKVIDGEVRCQDIFVASDNDDLTGFLYGGVNHGHARVFQICIQPDARRWHRARLLVDTFLDFAAKRRADYCTLRVAVDIESNLFWQGIGFTLTGQSKGRRGSRQPSKKSREIFVYYKTLQKGLFSDYELAYDREVTVQDVQPVQWIK